MKTLVSAAFFCVMPFACQDSLLTKTTTISEGDAPGECSQCNRDKQFFG